jgi:hypothetical protein
MFTYLHTYFTYLIYLGYMYVYMYGHTYERTYICKGIHMYGHTYVDYATRIDARKCQVMNIQLSFLPFVLDELKTGVNPTALKFTTTTPALYVVR